MVIRSMDNIVKMFQEKFPHVSFTKSQIQEKEKELKREYHLFKEAKEQSGAHFNSTLGIIEADPPVWNNIITITCLFLPITSCCIFSPVSMNLNTYYKPFPLFDTLGELYDAQGSLNFTSVEPRPSEHANVIQPSESEAVQNDDYNFVARAMQPPISLEDDDDGDVSIVQQPSQRCAGTTSSRPFASRRGRESDPPSAGRKDSKKQKQEHVVGMMQKYLEAKTMQVEGEVADKAKAVAEADDFSIKNCISRLNTIEELSGEEKAEAFDVFKDEQNRQIFMTAEPVSRLIWLRKEMASLPYSLFTIYHAYIFPVGLWLKSVILSAPCHCCINCLMFGSLWACGL